MASKTPPSSYDDQDSVLGRVQVMLDSKDDLLDSTDALETQSYGISFEVTPESSFSTDQDLANNDSLDGYMESVELENGAG